MIGYKIYEYDDVYGYQFVQSVPERRKDSTRITDDSIMNLARKVVGVHVDIAGILVVPIVLDRRSTEYLADA